MLPVADLRDVLPAREVADFTLMTLSKLGGDQEMDERSGESRKLRYELDEELFAFDEPRLCLFVERAANRTPQCDRTYHEP